MTFGKLRPTDRAVTFEDIIWTLNGNRMGNGLEAITVEASHRGDKKTKRGRHCGIDPAVLQFTNDYSDGASISPNKSRLRFDALSLCTIVLLVHNKSQTQSRTILMLRLILFWWFLIISRV